MTSRHLPRLVTALALLAFGLAFVERAPEADAASLCVPLDRPETGIPGDVRLADQLPGRAGEGTGCGRSRVGHSAPGGGVGNAHVRWAADVARSEEHTTELHSIMRVSNTVFSFENT